MKWLGLRGTLWYLECTIGAFSLEPCLKVLCSLVFGNLSARPALYSLQNVRGSACMLWCGHYKSLFLQALYTLILPDISIETVYFHIAPLCCIRHSGKCSEMSYDSSCYTPILTCVQVWKIHITDQI